MKGKKRKFLAIAAITIVIIVLLVWYLATHSIPVFEPGGVLAQKEKGLMIFALLLAVIVVVPTFLLAIMIAIKYNEKNVKQTTKYRPDYNRNKWMEITWWGIPIIIIAILSYVAWTTSFSLSPYKKLASDKQPLTIQVVSMDWKWLFIYPQQGVASVNSAAIPVNTPVNFKVTSDTIMNSFWVPGLGGQIYSMPGMVTQINEMATRTGDFAGSPANIAGKGFARMNFKIHSMSEADFSNWLARARQADKPLNDSSYAKLAKPSMSVPVSYYSSVEPDLFSNIVMKYMMPTDSNKKQSKSNSDMSKPTVMPDMSGDNQTTTTPKQSPMDCDMDMSNMKGMDMSSC